MFIVDKTGKSVFVLLDGTKEKIEFDWPTGACPPGSWGAKVYQALSKLRGMLSQQSPPMVPLVDGILLGWVYTSLETQRLREQNDELVKRIDKLEHDLRNVQAVQAAREMKAERGSGA